MVGAVVLPRTKLTLGNRALSPTMTKREYAEKRLAGMQARRKDFEPEIVEIASLAQPKRTRFINALATNGKSRVAKANRLYSGKGIRSFRYLTGGMYSGLSSPNRPWFRFVLEDRDLMEFHPVKTWLAEVEKIIGTMLATSNFYSACKIGYSEIGLFGTDACIMDEKLDFTSGLTRPVCFPQTFGEYWIACNASLEPDTLLRQATMTVRQMVEKFVRSKANPSEGDWSKVTQSVMTAWDNSNYENEIPVYHMIEPNPDHIPGRQDAAGKAWRSIKWEAGQGDKQTLLEENGYHAQPFWAPRWEITGTDDYGQGPGHDALADLRGLQLQSKRKGEATDWCVKPGMVATPGTKVRAYPGSITYAAAADQATLKPLYQVDYRAVEVIGRDVETVEDALDDATYAKLFMAISNMEGSADRTVPEIASRNEEKLTQLGPVIERVNTEKLQVAIDRAFDLAVRNELLPPPPEELSGMALQLDFISILAQAQRMIGMSQTERAIGFVGQLEQVFPGSGAGDNVNVDELVTDYWDRAGAPPRGLRDPKDRDAMRAAAAQQAQAARMAQMAKPAADMAGAAKDMASTPVNGGNGTLFDSVLGAGASAVG